ncbi:MAG: glycine--tRNA ligase subunit beta, partial [Gammaproteobacteria bacterium]|nr:glycine--tRNA ligase subunit beta [Gammaproteobacteria bacterium]
MPKKNKAGAQSLLIELLTEELPPGSLRRIAGAFAAGIHEGLRAQHFLDGESAVETFATPRRLAVRMSGVLPRQPDRLVDRKGPPVSAALDAQGRPTPALLGFARSCGTDVSRLKRHKDARGEYFLWRTREK